MTRRASQSESKFAVRGVLLALALISAACDGEVGDTDAGHDAGSAQDSGSEVDAGTDAGPCGSGCSEDTVCDVDAGLCVGCVQHADCPEDAPVCDVASSACVACLAHEDCVAPERFCDTSGSRPRCVECLEEGHCADAGLLCDPPSRTCVQSGETCATAAPLTVMPDGTTSFSVSTDSARNDDFGTCGDATPNGNAELVYRLQLAQAQDVEITATPAMGSNADPVVYVRAAPCADGATLGCEDVPAPEDGGVAPESLVLRNVMPGDYYLFLETFRERAGVFEVTVSLSPPSMAPEHDTCAAAMALTLTDGGTTFVADTTLAGDDYTPLCNPAGNSPELVYELTVAQDTALFITATGAPGVKPVLYLSQSPCDPSGLVACSDVRTSGAPEENVLNVLSVSPGTYYLFVESDGTGARGPIEVTVGEQPPITNESCLAPKTLFIPSGGSTSFQVDTTGASNDEESSCRGNLTAGQFQEFVYKVSLTQPQDLLVDVVNPSGSQADAIVYVREATCATGAELTCWDYGSSSEHVKLYGLQPGDYFVFIETYSTYSGPMDVTVSLRTPVVGEVCEAPIVVTFPPGVNKATYQVDTTLAGDEDYGSCSYYGGEHVYEVTLTSTKTITLTATANVDPANVDPVLYARSAPCFTGTELDCVDTIGPTDTLVLASKPAGTYYLFVETWTPYDGLLDVTIEVSP